MVLTMKGSTLTDHDAGASRRLRTDTHRNKSIDTDLFLLAYTGNNSSRKEHQSLILWKDGIFQRHYSHRSLEGHTVETNLSVQRNINTVSTRKKMRTAPPLGRICVCHLHLASASAASAVDGTTCSSGSILIGRPTQKMSYSDPTFVHQ